MPTHAVSVIYSHFEIGYLLNAHRYLFTGETLSVYQSLRLSTIL